MKRAAALGAVLALVAISGGLLAGCTKPRTEPTTPATTAASPTATSGSGTPSPSASPSPTPTAHADFAWGPTGAQWAAALAAAKALPEDQEIGEVMVVALRTPDAKAAAALVTSHHLGGVILMGGSVPGVSRITALTSAVQAVGDARGLPVLIATDEEGGTVSRLSSALPTLPAFMSAGALGDDAQTKALWTTHARQMRGLGINVDFAPDSDVTVGLKDPTIRTRSASSDPALASSAVVAASAGLEAGGVVPVIKHFPGHGSATSNSHVSLAYVSEPLTTLEKRDFAPFKASIAAGAPVVMMGHLVVGEWGSLPASVNPAAYAYLRGPLGFDGVTITDALDMKGVTDIYPPGTVEAKALEAGADVLLMPKNVDVAIAGIRKALASGALTKERLDDAAAMTMLLAQWQTSLTPATGALTSDTAVSAASDVVAAKDCSALVGESVSITGGTSVERARLGAALTGAGVDVMTGAAAATADTSIALLSSDTKGAHADVVVALAGPWALAASDADVYVAAWGHAIPQLNAVARVLTQPGTAHGTWPVKLKLPYAVCE